MIVACFSPSALRIAAWRPASAGFTTVACSSFSLRSASCSWTSTSWALRTWSMRVSCSVTFCLAMAVASGPACPASACLLWTAALNSACLVSLSRRDCAMVTSASYRLVFPS